MLFGLRPWSVSQALFTIAAMGWAKGGGISFPDEPQSSVAGSYCAGSCIEQPKSWTPLAASSGRCGSHPDCRNEPPSRLPAWSAWSLELRALFSLQAVLPERLALAVLESDQATCVFQVRRTGPMGEFRAAGLGNERHRAQSAAIVPRHEKDGGGNTTSVVLDSEPSRSAALAISIGPSTQRVEPIPGDKCRN